jgi:ketosteroid isomerase-like protein
MAKSRIMIMLVASAALLAGCERTQPLPDGATAAQANIAADEQTIRGTAERWVQLIRSKDAAAIAQLYTEDGALMPPNMPIATGRPAIEQVWASMMRTPGFDLTFAPEQILVAESGDLALDRGTYRLSEDTGKYVVVWRKVGGEWKAAADIFNSDKPGA